MAFTYGFYNSLKGDRKYNAEQMSEIFDGILKDGVIPSQGQLFVVKSAENGMQITVGTGRAWFDHTWSKNDSVMVLTVPKSDITRPRYDAVVLEVNHEQMVRANEIKIVQGESAVNPIKPTLVNTDKVKQYPLAYILVKAAVTEIKAEDIENMVGRSPTVFATGILETVAIDDLWSQWAGEWKTWFDNIKLQLTENVVTNLQYQINQLNEKVPEKATNSETITGSNTTKYTTPSGVKAAIDANKNYIKVNGGPEYKLVARDYLPRLPSDDDAIRNEAPSGVVIYLADYAVLHYENKIWVFDQSGNVRYYKITCNLDMRWLLDTGLSYRLTNGIITKPAIAIKGTNSYIALSNNSLYRITIGPSKPTIELYYTWTSSDGTPVLLGYVDEEWSILVLKLSEYYIRIFKIPNSYVSQPTIFSSVSLVNTADPNFYFQKAYYGISNNFIWYLELGLERISDNWVMNYAIVNGLTGTATKKLINFSTVNTNVADVFCDTTDNQLYMVYYLDGDTSDKIMKCSGKTYTISDVNNSAHWIPQLIDQEHGYYYGYASDTILEVAYRNDVVATEYTIPESNGYGGFNTTFLDNPIILGTSNYIKFRFRDNDNQINSQWMITNPSMTEQFIYLENFPPYGIDHSYRSTTYPSDYPQPVLMVYDRFIYTGGKSGRAKYDMLARDFIGIPV